MNCRKAQQAMQLQIDGELPERWRPALLRHLNSCESCRRVQEQTALISGALDELSAATASRSAARLPIGPPSRKGPMPLAIAAMIAILVGSWAISHAIRVNTESGKILLADRSDPHHSVSNGNTHEPGGVTGGVGISRWWAMDYSTWIGFILVLLFVALLSYRTGKRQRAP